MNIIQPHFVFWCLKLDTRVEWNWNNTNLIRNSDSKREVEIVWLLEEEKERDREKIDKS